VGQWEGRGTVRRVGRWVVILRCAFALALLNATADPARSQAMPPGLQPPGRLVDLGGYRLHLWCAGPTGGDAPTIVLSAGGGDFAVDWSLVQVPLSDSMRVCSYDRAGFGLSEPGPYPRTFRQEAFELHTALKNAGERVPYIVVGHSLGAFVVRTFAETYGSDVVGIVLVAPTNENGKLGFRGKWTLPRTHATERPVPPARTLAESPPIMMAGVAADSCRARAERIARIWRPYDQLRAQAQKYRVWALQHPSCVVGQDDFFAEELAGFFEKWEINAHPLGDLPLTVIVGTRLGPPPPGLSETEIRSDSLRIDLSRLSRHGRLVADTLSGHHVHLDNPAVVVDAIRELTRQIRERRVR
jgi:pimeloyl-ACP methyl ester carboxylesterase